MTWEAEKAASGLVTADVVFVILRGTAGNRSMCWSNFEYQTPTDDPDSQFQFKIEDGEPCDEELSEKGNLQNLWNLMNWNTFIPAQYQFVEPLVKFCMDAGGQTMFGESTAIPQVVSRSWTQDKIRLWTLYVMNPTSLVEPPKATVKLKGDEKNMVEIHDFSDNSLSGPPLVSCGSSN